MHHFGQVILVAVGSAVGGVARWSVGLAIARVFSVVLFPLHTLLINVVGCFVLGWFMARFESHALPEHWMSRDDFRLLFAVGFTGGFTTFSSFIFETQYQIGVSRAPIALLYVGLSLFLGLGAMYLGLWLGQ